jgi:hypothetical protein
LNADKDATKLLSIDDKQYHPVMEQERHFGEEKEEKKEKKILLFCLNQNLIKTRTRPGLPPRHVWL